MAGGREEGRTENHKASRRATEKVTTERIRNRPLSIRVSRPDDQLLDLLLRLVGGVDSARNDGIISGCSSSGDKGSGGEGWRSGNVLVA